ncbi:glycosyltransferase family A protein [Aequorivita viscosa]|nr:glycosyltransferase family A protein [Aequorivita viscosa]
MIVLLHDDKKITAVKNINDNGTYVGKEVVKGIFLLAENNPLALVVWCAEEFEPSLNLKELKNIFHHKRLMASFSVSGKHFLLDDIGYVEDSPFIKIKHNITYPTWLMATDVGGIYAETLLQFKGLAHLEDFEYFLTSIAKNGQPKGLLCYSEPKLLVQQPALFPRQRGSRYSTAKLFRFVKQHYRTRWVFLLFLNLFLYEKKLPFIALLKSLFYRNFSINCAFNDITLQSSRSITIDKRMDVIIPTIGRKTYLYDVLKDLAGQTILPQKIIIVEQNPDPESESELDYLRTETWPFTLDHHFTHVAGACNARNIALQKTTAPWVFLADDDNRLEAVALEKAFFYLNKTASNAITSSYLQKNEKKTFNEIIQWPTFGAGNSFVAGTIARRISFNTAYEFGYGEDVDYGMQLRNIGVDVLYIPQLQILHLKAPVGGFRKTSSKAWELEKIIPKPSPTVMLFKLKHNTDKQILGYKTVLFLKYYRNQGVKNPFSYIKMMQKRWESSKLWAKQLQDL